jgi:hypothetical protein
MYILNVCPAFLIVTYTHNEFILGTSLSPLICGALAGCFSWIPVFIYIYLCFYVYIYIIIRYFFISSNMWCFRRLSLLDTCLSLRCCENVSFITFLCFYTYIFIFVYIGMCMFIQSMYILNYICAYISLLDTRICLQYNSNVYLRTIQNMYIYIYIYIYIHIYI